MFDNNLITERQVLLSRAEALELAKVIPLNKNYSAPSSDPGDTPSGGDGDVTADSIPESMTFGDRLKTLHKTLFSTSLATFSKSTYGGSDVSRYVDQTSVGLFLKWSKLMTEAPVERWLFITTNAAESTATTNPVVFNSVRLAFTPVTLGSLTNDMTDVSWGTPVATTYTLEQITAAGGFVFDGTSLSRTGLYTNMNYLPMAPDTALSISTSSSAGYGYRTQPTFITSSNIYIAIPCNALLGSDVDTYDEETGTWTCIVPQQIMFPGTTGTWQAGALYIADTVPEED